MGFTSFKEHYELKGDDLQSAIDARLAYRSAEEKMLEGLGALFGCVGMTRYGGQGAGGAIAQLKFESDPGKGWRDVGRNLYQPALRTKEGKNIAQQLKDAVAELPEKWASIPDEIRKAQQFTSNSLMFTVINFVDKPSVRAFVSVPRCIDDDLQIPSTWEIIAESEVDRAYAMQAKIHETENA